MLCSQYPFELPPLPYAYDALEPHIDAETMHFHHDNHFGTYIKNLNKALAPYPEFHNCTLDYLLTHPDQLPREAREPIMRNAGGVYNHRLFFEGLAPADQGCHQPEGQLLALINSTYGSVEAMKDTFSSMALSVFGSGYSCLGLNPHGALCMVTLANQDAPLSRGVIPLMLFDVWEHAYYLKYKYRRADYVENLWPVIVFPELVAGRH